MIRDSNPAVGRIGNNHLWPRHPGRIKAACYADGVSIAVSDLTKAAKFYDHVLAPLALRRVVERERSIGFGKTYPELWLNLREGFKAPENSGHHICLRAPTEAAVQAFYAAALGCGGIHDRAP